jgi:Zn-dependent peptidase ImmA (M78 family)
MNELIIYLLNVAFDNGINIVWTDQLAPDKPSCAMPNQNTIIVNNRWRNQDEIPFQLAHEIGHMLNEDEGVLYYCSPASHTKVECGANDKAIDLILNYCVVNDEPTNNYADFMYCYGIPYSLEENVKRRYAYYFKR